MRPAETNTRPRFTLPPGSCDTHFHVFEPGYAHVAEPLYTFPDATLDQYLAAAKHLGIERMVLVQPTFYGTDNTLALDVLRRVGPAARAVVRVEEDVSDVELDRMHDLGVRAIRLDLFARAQLPTAEIIDYVRRMARRTSPRGWHLQFYAPGRVVRDLLPFLADFDETFVIDHMGYMKQSDGLTEQDATALLDVLRQGRCWIKLSGPYRIAGDKPMSTLHELGSDPGRHPCRPADLGIRLAPSPQRPARHRRASGPARGLGTGRAGPPPDPGGRRPTSSSSRRNV